VACEPQVRKRACKRWSVPRPDIGMWTPRKLLQEQEKRADFVLFLEFTSCWSDSLIKDKLYFLETPWPIRVLTEARPNQ
jgi:hypothetical protein